MMDLILGEPQSPGPFLAEPLLNEPTSDHRVRYLACEALFNVAKVAGEALLKQMKSIEDIRKVRRKVRLLDCKRRRRLKLT